MTVDRISDQLLKSYLKRASDYTGIPLEISKYNPDGRCRYTLVDADGHEYSRSLMRSEIYDALFTICQIFPRMHTQSTVNWQHQKQQPQQNEKEEEAITQS
jgi:hypothetical protein